MRRILRAVLVVLLLVGLVVAAAGVVESEVGSTQAVPPAQVLVLVPNTIGWTPTELHWSGGDGNTTVDLIAGSPHVAEFRYLCQAAPGLIAQGRGGSGSLSVTLSGGSPYSLYACTGNSGNPIYGVATTFTYAFLGLSYASVTGVVIAVLAALLLSTRVRGRMGRMFTSIRGSARESETQ